MESNAIKTFTTIKISYSNLKIKLYRHSKTAVENRNMHLCLLDVEDEFHFLIRYAKLIGLRSEKKYPDISKIVPSFHNLANDVKFNFNCLEYVLLEL